MAIAAYSRVASLQRQGVALQIVAHCRIQIAAVLVDPSQVVERAGDAIAVANAAVKGEALRQQLACLLVITPLQGKVAEVVEHARRL